MATTTHGGHAAMDAEGGAAAGYACPYVSGRAALSTPAKVTSWVLQLLVAGILVQTLFFKFTAAPESVYIFSKLGMEPWGRIGSGVAELVAAVLLLWPRMVSLGAVLALGVIGGAIGAHLTRLGIVVQDDGGLLFGLAIVVCAGSAAIVALRRQQLGVYLRGAQRLVAGRQ